MNLKRLVPYIVSVLLILMCGAPMEMQARKSSKKARTEQTSKSKGKSKKSGKGKNSSKSKKNSRKSKNGSKSKKSGSSKKRSLSSRGNVRRTTVYTPKPEVAQNDSLTLAVNTEVLRQIPSDQNPGGLRVNSVKVDHKSRSIRVGLNDNFTYMPVTKESISELEGYVRHSLPDSISDLRVNLQVNNHPLSYYINRIDKLPEQYRKNPPFVKEAVRDNVPDKGMENDIIALWSSHGRYFRPASGAWMWQRGVLFETIEDIYTMGYVLPYIAPMLENAGAYVFMPRERDINRNEVIVDNDTNEDGNIYSQPYYKEVSETEKWFTGEEEGFIYDLKDFRDTENPFENGTYRQVKTITSGKPSYAAWCADIPEDGEYAVYVSYKTVPGSTEDAHYTVNYSGGSKEFIVNQSMGGGTWIYLGTFPFRSGYSSTEPVVLLSNKSSKPGQMVTADAIKLGGGMGNIARSRSRSDIYYDPSTPEQIGDDEDDEDDADAEDAEDEETVDDEGDIAGDGEAVQTGDSAKIEVQKKGIAPIFRTSGYPRYLEGARYWLHWAGFPESIYSPYHGTDDYKDDYTNRGHWVTYLSGGSRVRPDADGLNLPVDLSLALHSDAGKRSDDSFVGTLGIYYTQGGGSYTDGTPRINSRMLTDLVMRQITNDIRKKYEPRWTRRSMWDKSYVEARVPEVPTTLIELMSHQNFADMKYGLDPNFRFDVSRSIYKGIARFLGERKGREVVIQPLPVKDFMIKKTGNCKYRLSWSATDDPLEPTAKPDKYIVYERTQGVLGFHKIGETSSSHFDVKVNDEEIHSFKIIAANRGGVSFPSEVLALRDAAGDKSPVLVVNGFTRLSGPASFSDSGTAGFHSEEDFGVPYIRDISFAGHQTEFRRNAGDAFGRGSNAYETKVIAGNTFDFVADHGKAIAAGGRGFVSASLGAVERGHVNMDDYKLVDLILGKQKSTVIGNGKSGILYRTFPKELQSRLRSYIKKGGDLIISGQYVVSDLTGKYADEEDKLFAEEVLGIVSSEGNKPRTARIEGVTGTPLSYSDYSYSSTLNDKSYIVEQPDFLLPTGYLKVKPMFTFSDNDALGGVLTENGKSKMFIMSVPFESLKDSSQKNDLMRKIFEIIEK